jgi:hypothetical protein
MNCKYECLKGKMTEKIEFLQLMKMDLIGKTELQNFTFGEQQIYINSILPSNKEFDYDEVESYFATEIEFKNYEKSFSQFKKSLSEEQYEEVIRLFHTVALETSPQSPVLHILFINRESNKLFYFKIPPIVVYVHVRAKHNYYVFNYSGTQTCSFLTFAEDSQSEFFSILHQIKQFSLQLQFANLYKKNDWCNAISSSCGNNDYDNNFELFDETVPNDLYSFKKKRIISSTDSGITSKFNSQNFNELNSPLNDKEIDIFDFKQSNSNNSIKNQGNNSSEKKDESRNLNDISRKDTAKIKKTSSRLEASKSEVVDGDRYQINKRPPQFGWNSRSESKQSIKNDNEKSSFSTNTSIKDELTTDSITEMPETITKPRVLPVTVNVNFNVDMFENRKTKYIN